MGLLIDHDDELIGPTSVALASSDFAVSFWINRVSEPSGYSGAVEFASDEFWAETYRIEYDPNSSYEILFNINGVTLANLGSVTDGDWYWVGMHKSGDEFTSYFANADTTAVTSNESSDASWGSGTDLERITIGNDSWGNPALELIFASLKIWVGASGPSAAQLLAERWSEHPIHTTDLYFFNPYDGRDASGTENYTGGSDLTAGSQSPTVDTHPPVFSAARRGLYVPEAAAGPSTNILNFERGVMRGVGRGVGTGVG